MTIYDSTGTIVYEAPITTSAIIKRVLMGDYYIELVFDAVDRIDVGRGSYILYNGHKFEIMSNTLPEDTNTGGFRYTLRFEAQQSQMKRCKVFWRDSDNLEVSFSNTTSLSSFGALIVQNVNAFLGSDNWSLGDYPTELETTLKTVSFNGDSCWDAVATIAETFGVEWWTEESGDSVCLCFGKLETGTAVEFKKGDIVSSIPSKKGDDANYGTRFYVFGSTKNLPSDYSSTEEGGITNHVVEKRLYLPDGQQYIDAWDNLAQKDIVEQVVFFDDVFPTNVETITSIAHGHEEIIEGEQNLIYHVKCDDSPFTLDDVIEGETIQANFTSGALNGMTFDVEIDTTASEFDKWFKIKPNVIDADSGLIIPNESLAPSIGDTFILIGVELPQGRIDEAEQTLLEVGTEYAKKNSNDTDIYDCPTNAVYCHKNRCNYDLGQRVTLVDQKFGDGGRASRIQGYEKKLYDEYQATYTVGDNSPYSRLATLEKAVQKSSYGDRVGLEANIIRSKSDSTLPSDYNVYSALATEGYFLSKRRGGTVKGHTDFAKGISMYGIPWEYDVEKDAWTIKGNVIITRGLAVYSTLKDEDIISVYDGIPIDNQTIQWKDVDGGKVLVVNPDMIGGSGNIDEDAVNELIDAALEDYVPTTTQIIAGTGLTGGGTLAANRTLSLATTGTAGTYAKVTTDAYGRVTSGTTLSALDIPNLSWSKITSGKPTTLSGYGITDAYTKTEVGENFLAIDGIAERAKILAGSLTATSYMLFSGNELNHCNNGSTNNFWFGYRQPSGSARTTNKWLFSSSSSSKLPDGDIQAGRLRLGSTDTNIPSPRYTLDVEGNASVEGTFYLNGAAMTYNSSKNAWQIDGNLIVTGGIAAYTKLSGFTDLDVMGGVVVDGETITIENGALKVIGGTSSGDSVSITGAASTIVSSNLTASRALISNSSGKVAVSAVTSTELGYLDGVTSAIQTQLDDKQAALVSGANIKTINGTSILGSGNISVSAESATNIVLGTVAPESTTSYYPAMVTGATNGSSYGIKAFGNPVRYALRVGTSSATGIAELILGNSTNKGTAGNSEGALCLYPATSSYYSILKASSSVSANYTNYLPKSSGTLLNNNGGVISGDLDIEGILSLPTTSSSAFDAQLFLGQTRIGGSTSGDVGIYGRGIYLRPNSLSSNSGIGLSVASTGNVTVSGTVTENSARKLKDVDYEGEGIGLDVLKKVKVAKWKWKDKRDKKMHIGAIAEDLADIIPEVVFESEDEYGATTPSIAYGKAGFSIAASLIAPVTRHEDRIKELEKDIEKMQKELDKLKKTA